MYVKAIMKNVEWNEDKNTLLKKTRGIGFEDICIALESKKIIDVINNPNYSNQNIFIIKLNNYVYVVPFVEDERKVFLKTIIPNRKYAKKYQQKYKRI